MSNDPAFLFYPGDYLRDTQCLSEKTQVAYDRIMCEHMRNICVSQQQLKFFTKRLTEDEKEELMLLLTKINGGYHIKWVSESISKRKAYSESRRNNRVKKQEKHMLSHDTHMENENEIEIEDVNKKGVENKKDSVTKKKPNYLDQILNVWCECYKDIRGIEFLVTNKAKETTAISKLLTQAKRKDPDATSADMLESFREYFTSCLRIEEKFIFENASPSIIYNQFNKIQNILSDGKSKSHSQSRAIDSKVNEYFGK